MHIVFQHYFWKPAKVLTWVTFQGRVLQRLITIGCSYTISNAELLHVTQCLIVLFMEQEIQPPHDLWFFSLYFRSKCTLASMIRQVENCENSIPIPLFAEWARFWIDAYVSGSNRWDVSLFLNFNTSLARNWALSCFFQYLNFRRVGKMQWPVSKTQECHSWYSRTSCCV